MSLQGIYGPDQELKTGAGQAKISKTRTGLVVRGSPILATHNKNKIFQFIKILFVFFNMGCSLTKVVVDWCNELKLLFSSKTVQAKGQ